MTDLPVAGCSAPWTSLSRLLFRLLAAAPVPLRLQLLSPPPTCGRVSRPTSNHTWVAISWAAVRLTVGAALRSALHTVICLPGSPAAPGGGVENVGVSRALTEMLVGSGVLVPALFADGSAPPGGAQWVTRLFPAWPANLSASFSGLVAKGGVAVAASYNATSLAVASPVQLWTPFATNASNVTLRSPWQTVPRASVTAVCGGSPAALTWVSVIEGNGSALALSLLVPPNATCAVSLTRSRVA